MILMIYIIKTVLISGLLVGYYWLFLRNRAFHRFNRFFLVSIPVLAFLLPVLQFRIPEYWNRSTGSQIRLLGVGRGTLEEAVTVYATRNSGTSFSWEYILLTCSIVISIILFARFFKTIRFLYLLRRNKPFLVLPEATVYFVTEKGTPFSFFNSIFWGKELELNSMSGKHILRHELFHVKQNHSLDIMILEFFSILTWFNPFLHLLHNELKAIHEYGADEYALAETDTYTYARLLLKNNSGSSVPLTNPFFKNQIKKRITMMTKSQKNKNALTGRFMVLPLIAILIGLFSFKMQKDIHLLSVKPMRVVIDAGHGGSFTGAVSNGLLEKNINLIIAKKIQSLSKEYNVDVIMSRETDVTPGSNELRESLEYIAALPKNKNADLFISIHTNVAENAEKRKLQTSKSGFEIYVPRNSSEVYESSVKLGSVLAEVIKSDYAIEPELKQTQDDGGNILVLKKATVPAILIECGYMDNPTDLKYLQNERSLEKMARDILEGIQKFGDQNTSFMTVPLSNGSFTNFEATGHGEISADSLGPLRKVEVEADFPGGANAWIKYLTKTLQYPMEAISNEIQGEVLVEFVVRKDGTLTDIHAKSGPKQLIPESIRVVQTSGNWVAAMDHGVKVDSYHIQPINYKLETK